MAPVHSREVGWPAALHSSGSSSNPDADNSESLLTAALHRPQAEGNRRQPELEVMETEDLVDQILLRFPPDDPAALTRASLVCKSWFNLLSDKGFRRSYRILHNTPPMLGFLHTWQIDQPTWMNVARFVPTAGFRPRNPERLDRFVLDCRHGRIILGYERVEFEDRHLVLDVWDPMTESCKELRQPDAGWWEYSACVVCAVPGCNHDGCGAGPFLVVLVGFYSDGAYASIYSSETREWGSRVSLHSSPADDFNLMNHVLVGGKLNFLFLKDGVLGILSYDLVKHCLAMIDTPSVHFPSRSSLLMKMEDGALGLAYLDDKLSLHMWSRGAVAWTQTRVIDLKMMALPGVEEISPMLVGSAEGAGIIFVITSLGTYTINLRSLTSRMVSPKPYICEEQGLLKFLYPYMSFSNPQGADKLQKEAKNHSDEAGSSFQAMVGTSGSMVGTSGSATTPEAEGL